MHKTVALLLLFLSLSVCLSGNTIPDSISLPVDQLQPSNQIEKLWLNGLDAQDKGYFITALSLIDSSLCILQDEVGLSHPFSATAMNHLGNIYYEEGYIAEAYNYQTQALIIRQEFFGPQHLETAKSYNNLANCFLTIGDYERAILLYQQTAQIREASADVLPTDLAAIYNNLGNAHLALGQWSQAKLYCKKALRIRQEALGDADLKTAQSQLSLGNVFAAQQQADSALICFKQSLPVYLEHYGEHHPQLASLYENMGNAYTALNQFEAAAQLLEKALGIRQQFYGGAHPDLIRSCQNIGELWLQRGDYQQAHQYFQQALDLLLRLWGEYHPQVAQAYEQLGLALLYLGKTTAAKARFQQVIALRQSLLGQEHPFVAGSWLNLGNAFWQEENYDQARTYFEQSLAIWEQAGTDWQAEQFKACLNICQTYLEQKQTNLALKTLDRAKQFLPTTQTIAAASYWRTVAGAHQQLGQYEMADSLLTKTLSILNYDQFKTDKEGRIPPLELLLCLQSKGLNHLAWAKAVGNVAMAQLALRYLEEAIDWMMVLQTTYANPEARQQLAALNQPLFEGAIESCVFLAENGNDPLLFYQKAVVLSERNKSVRLLEANFLHNHSNDRLPDSLVQALQQASLHVNQLEKQLTLDTEQLDRNELRNRQDQLFFWQRKQTETNKAIKRYATSGQALDHLYLSVEKLADIQAALGKDAAILSFFHGKNKQYVFVLNQQKILVKRLSSDFNWQASVRDLGKSIIQFPTASPQGRTALDSSYTAIARQLYEQLFPSLNDHIKHQERLLIIPDGIFNYLPFEALLTAAPTEAFRYRSYPYLIKDHTISYAYSISQWMNDRQRAVPYVPADRSCLAIAPTFHKNDPNFAPLEHNLSEAKAVLTQFPGQLLEADMATRRQFLSNAGEYAILHLATHALTNMTNGDYAYFLLAADEPDSIDFHSKLYVKDFYAQHWKAQLAVLSACETGIGNFRSGEGVISLGRGFAQAGVRSTVSSLWQINDAQTASLMEEFYRLLKSGHRKDEALQSAKLSLLARSSHDMAHPFYWASYVPYGDMTPLQIGRKGLLWWCLGLAGLLGLIAVKWIRSRKLG